MLGVTNKLASAWHLVAKRGIAHWRLLSAVVLGVLLASAIMSGTVIYYDALRELALRQALGRHSQVDLDVLVQGEGSQVSPEAYQRLSSMVNGETDRRVGWMVLGRTSAGKTPTFFLTDWQISLDWADSSEAEVAGYNVLRSTSPTGPYEQVNSSLVAASEFTDAGLTNGTTYYYVVTALDGQGDESGASAEARATPQDTTPPSAPAGVTASAGDTRVALEWSASTERDIAGYNVYRSTISGDRYWRRHGQLTYPPIAATAFTDTRLANGATYYYVVTAIDSSGNESHPSVEVSSEPTEDTVPPAAPTALLATPGDGRAALDWGDSPEVDLAGYNVLRSTTSSGPYTRINPSPVAASAFTDVGLANGIAYHYVLTAVDHSGNESHAYVEASATPELDVTPPVPPSGLAVTRGDNHASLDWDDSPEEDLAGYRVLQSTTSTGPYTQINPSLVTTSAFSDSRLTNGTAYYYVVTAVDYSSNESGSSTEVSTTPTRDPSPPAAPVALTATPRRHQDFGDARAYFAFLSRLQEHARILPGGTGPRDDRLNKPGLPLELEALVPVEAVRSFGLSVGDRLVAVPHWADDVPYVTVVIVGIFERANPTSEYWRLYEAALRRPESSILRTVPFYLSPEAYLGVLGPSFRRMSGAYAWLLVTDTGRLNPRNAETALAGIEGMHRTLSAAITEYRQTTAVDQAIAEYDRRVFFGRLPMFVVLILTAVVILYYVATLSSLMVEDKRNEVSLLRSRGASSAQILMVFVLEGMTIAILSVLLGPLLGAGAISFLGVTPAFSELTGGSALAVHISSGAYLMSGIGGILSFLTLMVPAVEASRLGVTQNRQVAARPSRAPMFQRYYVDVLLLLLGILLARQLTEQGSMLARSQFGELAASQMLLALPALILVASAMVLLRLFPPAMALASRVLSSRLPAGLAMGLWQMARSPTHYARLALLLILMAGLGTFVSSFGATLGRSFEDRALYAIGSDMRIDGGRATALTGSAASAARYERLPGVARASPVLRTQGRDESETYGSSFELLFVDIDSFGDVGWFRDDFADRPLPELLRPLRVTESDEGIELPYDARSLSVRLKADSPHPSIRLVARLKNRRNSLRVYDLGALESGDWADLETSLDSVPGESFLEARPLTLVGLGLEETGGGQVIQGGSILIDDISITAETGETKTVEAFDDMAGWSAYHPVLPSLTDSLRVAGDGSDGDSGSVLFTWSTGGAPNGRGIHFRGLASRQPLPVLASESFIRETGHYVGEEFEVSVLWAHRTVRLVDTVKLFPTMTTPGQRFLVADLYSLNRARLASLPGVSDLPPLDRRPAEAVASDIFRQTQQARPNEVWLSTVSSTSSQLEGLRRRLSDDEAMMGATVFDSARRLEESRADPLMEAGWRSLLIVAFSAVLILGCVGFPVHAYVSFRNRRLQFALLRTVGFSRRQLAMMVWSEQVLVIAAGLALGTWMGGRLGEAIMPFLGHDFWGGEAIPPFVVELDWDALLVTYASIGIVFGLIILSVSWLVRRISLQNTLRIGEM